MESLAQVQTCVGPCRKGNELFEGKVGFYMDFLNRRIVVKVYGKHNPITVDCSMEIRVSGRTN